MKGKRLIVVCILVGVAGVGYRYLPSYYNPFVPLQLNDPPGSIMQHKLRRQDPLACQALLEQATQQPFITSTQVADGKEECPLTSRMRARDLGPGRPRRSFLAILPRALS